jgi:adenine-specific DNA-methyltransferase
MLNLLVDYQAPQSISKVSGIPTDWNRSPWYVRSKSLPHFRKLIQDLDARFILISFNDEGYIRISDMRRLLDSVGKVDELQVKYNTFRGSRNLQNRSTHVTEHLFLLDKLRR